MLELPQCVIQLQLVAIHGIIIVLTHAEQETALTDRGVGLKQMISIFDLLRWYIELILRNLQFNVINFRFGCLIKDARLRCLSHVLHYLIYE